MFVFTSQVSAKLNWAGDYAESFECPEEIKALIRARKVRLYPFDSQRVAYTILSDDADEVAFLEVTMGVSSKQIQWLREHYTEYSSREAADVALKQLYLDHGTEIPPFLIEGSPEHVAYMERREKLGGDPFKGGSKLQTEGIIQCR